MIRFSVFFIKLTLKNLFLRKIEKYKKKKVYFITIGPVKASSVLYAQSSLPVAALKA